jgi:hypothetical protein
VNENSVGRHKIVVDWDVVNKYLQAGCMGTEVAAVIGCGPDTLYRRCQEEHGINFEAYRQSQLAYGDSLLKDKQFKIALEGDKVMLIWLGKQRLGQKDKQEVEQKGGVEVKITREIKTEGECE